MLKLAPSPYWSLSQESPRKGQAPSQVALWIASGLPHTQVGLRCAFRQVSPGPLPAVFTIKLSAKTSWPCFVLYTVAATPQMQLVWSHKTTSPVEYNNGARKHRMVRGVQISLNTRPKPRASAYERGLTNLSTSQSTYANHRIFC